MEVVQIDKTSLMGKSLSDRKLPFYRHIRTYWIFFMAVFPSGFPALIVLSIIYYHTHTTIHTHVLVIVVL